MLFGNLADFSHRIDHTNFVVGVHDGDQDRLWRNRFAHILRINAPIAPHRQIRHFVAVLFQALAGVQYRLVLNGLRDDVIALLAVHFRDALDHQIVGFCRAASEDDLLRRGTYQRSHLRARVFHRFFAGPTKRVVAARRVPEFLGEIGQHRLHHTRIHWRGCVIVHVNRQLYSHLVSPKSATRRAPALATLRSSEKSLLCSAPAICFRSRGAAVHVPSSGP